MEEHPAQNETPQRVVIPPVPQALQQSSSVGRPTVLTADIVSKLVEIFKLGVTNEIAMSYAGVKERTFYENYKLNEDFRREIDNAKHFARIAASQAVVNSILGSREKSIKLTRADGSIYYKIIPEKEPNVETAKWWLEKKYHAEFGGNEAVYQQFNVGGEMNLSFLETNGSKIT